jgi:hypothetical protein
MSGIWGQGQVMCSVINGHCPAFWTSDRYGAQQGHGEHHQTCLAHLARDIAYAFEASDDLPSFRLNLWMGDIDRADGLRSHPQTPGQNRPSPRPTPDLHSRTTRPGRPHQQRLRAGSSARSDQPKSDQRLPLCLGRRRRCPLGRGYQSSGWSWPLQRNPCGRYRVIALR